MPTVSVYPNTFLRWFPFYSQEWVIYQSVLHGWARRDGDVYRFTLKQRPFTLKTESKLLVQGSLSEWSIAWKISLSYTNAVTHPALNKEKAQRRSLILGSGVWVLSCCMEKRPAVLGQTGRHIRVQTGSSHRGFPEKVSLEKREFILEPNLGYPSTVFQYGNRVMNFLYWENERRS